MEEKPMELWDVYDENRKLTGKKKSLKDKSRTLFSIVFFCRFIILGKSWSKTRREIPLFVIGFAFCSAKQGGIGIWIIWIL